MPTAPPHIRLPRWARVLAVLWVLGEVLRLVRWAVEAPTAADLVAYPLFAVFGLAVGYQLLRLGVDGDAERLVVRNVFRTRTFDRTAVTGFRPGRAPHQVPGVTCIFLLGANGAGYPLDGTVGLAPFQRRRTAADLDRLRAWLAA